MSNSMCMCVSVCVCVCVCIRDKLEQELNIKHFLKENMDVSYPILFEMYF